MSFWNEEEEQQPAYAGIEDGELVTCIILDSRYPASYLKEIEERQKAANEEAEAFGKLADAILPSHKEGGIEVRFAVLYRDRGTGDTLKENVIKLDNNELVEPDYTYVGTLRALPPALVKDASYYISSKGLDRLNVNGHPKVTDIYPGKYEARDWKNQLNYSDYLQNTDLQKEHPEEWKKISAIEKRRLEAWEKDIAAFAKLDEAKATDMLLTSIAARYGIMKLNEELDRWEYIRPEKGVMFQCRVSKKKDSKYLNLEKFRWMKDGTNGEYAFYGKMEATKAEEDDTQFADRIIEMLERNKTLRAQRAAEKNGVLASVDDDDVPF